MKKINLLLTISLIYSMNLFFVNAASEAGIRITDTSGVTVTRPFAGDVLTVDAANASSTGSVSHQWYYSTDPQGKVGRVKLGKSATQQLPDATIDKFVFVEMKGRGIAGGSVTSLAVGPVYGARSTLILQNGVTPDYAGVKAVGEMTDRGQGGLGASPVIRFHAGNLNAARNSLLYFPLSYTNNKRCFPDNAIITSAQLTLSIGVTGAAWGSGALNFYRIIDPDNLGIWEEGTISDYTGGIGSVATDGASFSFRSVSQGLKWKKSPNPSRTGISYSCLTDYTAVVEIPPYGGNMETGTPIVIEDLQSDIQAWVDGEVNQGWWIKGALTGSTNYSFASPRHETPALRPKLAITYYETDKTAIRSVDIDEDAITLSLRPGAGVDHHKVYWDTQQWGTAHSTVLPKDVLSCVLTEHLEYGKTYYLHAESYDAGGRLLSATENVTAPMTVDTTPPVTTVVVDGNTGKGNKNYQNVSITATGVQDVKSGTDFTEYRINDTEWVKVGLGERFTVSGHGVHIVKVRSVDKAGNVEPFQRFDICIDESDVTVDEPVFNGGSLSVVLHNRSTVEQPAVMIASLIDKNSGSVIDQYESAPARIAPKSQNNMTVSGLNNPNLNDCYFEIYIVNSTAYKAGSGGMQPVITAYYPQYMNPFNNRYYFHIPLIRMNNETNK